MALQVVRDFGEPAEVASRYRPGGFVLIEPEQVPAFLKLVVVLVTLQWVFTLPPVFHGSIPFSKCWLTWGLGAFWWVGVLFTVFASITWCRRHVQPDPGAAPQPPQRGKWHPSRLDFALYPKEGAVLWWLSAVLTAFFIALWVRDHLPVGASVQRTVYDEAFGLYLLPPLFVLMIARLVLFALVLVRQRSSTAMEDARTGLWVCFVALLWWALARWPVFSDAGANIGFKAWLVIFLIVNTIQIVFWLPRGLRRVRGPDLGAGSARA